MHLHATARPPAGRLALGMTVTAALAVTLAACGGSGSTAPHHSAAHGPAVPASSAPASAAAAAASASGLSGRWHGHYGGSYHGTFILNWRQSGSNLSGHIRLSYPSTTLPIHGTLSGSSIKFGTVGSYRITYSGTLSGSSMSGNWALKGAGQGGNWAAGKG